MTERIDQIIQKFMRGSTLGGSKSMQIIYSPKKRKTYLVGYGWAVYAETDMKTDRVTVYAGWKGYSKTTSRQMNKILKAAQTRPRVRILSTRKTLKL